jgi:hypothetical protein
MLALVVAVVPYYSFYLPLAFFAVLQVSALLQQLARPFIDDGDNRAELTSLYLLLFSYFSGLVLGFLPDELSSADVWSGALLVAHTSFMVWQISKAVRQRCLCSTRKRAARHLADHQEPLISGVQ